MGILKKKEYTPWEKAFRAVWKKEERFLRRYEKKTPSAIEEKMQRVDKLVEKVASRKRSVILRPMR